jgi:hypothetical protein
MQIMTMAIVENRWTSFAWDMKRRQMTIYDAGNKCEQWDAHNKVVKILNSALRTCKEAFFDGWNIDWENWATVYMSSKVRNLNSTDRLAPTKPTSNTFKHHIYSVHHLKLLPFSAGQIPQATMTLHQKHFSSAAPSTVSSKEAD